MLTLDGQLTPKPRPIDNPFDANPNHGPRQMNFSHHHLLNSRPSNSDLTPLANGFPSSLAAHATNFAAALPTASLSLHPPVMKKMPHSNAVASSSHNMTNPNSRRSSPSSSLDTVASHSSTTASKGQLHVKLIEARSLNVAAPHARPYVVVEFEQNEFVGRDPIADTDKEVKGLPTALSRTNSSQAISALGAINNSLRSYDIAKRGKPSASTTPQSSFSSARTVNAALNNGTDASSYGLFGRRASHSPIWKHEVSFDVTSDQSVITFNVYDRAVQDQAFLGMVEIKPTLTHELTVDQWHKLRPYENEVVTGEIRIQITYEQFKTRRAPTPRDFEFLKLIGRGTFGRVFQVRKKDTKRIYAMKVLSKREIIAKKEVAHTIGERKILQQSLDSPFLVGLKFSFQTDTDLYLVTDFKSGGELFWHLQKETRFSEERARFYIAELVLALEHLHKYDIVYRDLKPENILLDATGHVALCDFGLSKPDLKADQLTNTFCGTTEYLAPEVLLDDHGYSKLVDFWSLGVLLFEMCCGWSPFYAEDTQQMYQNICFGKIRFPRGVIGEDGKQFVKGLLNRNPKHRLGAQGDAEELKAHAFFKIIDWKALSLKQVTPPFKPVVESDESTNNFDPEFTSADIREIGLDAFEESPDEEDPSEDWVSQSINQSTLHTPNGPLGSDLVMQQAQAVVQKEQQKEQQPQQKEQQQQQKGTAGGAKAIQITNKKQKQDERAEPPLTSSVQEKFRGFSYSGESVQPDAAGLLLHGGDSQHGSEDNTPLESEVTTEDEFENDEVSGGRYSARNRSETGNDFVML